MRRVVSSLWAFVGQSVRNERKQHLGLLNKILRKDSGERRLGLADPDHPARKYIEEASIIADQAIDVRLGDDTTIMHADSAATLRLVSVIEKAIQKCGEDLDLLVAKSGALCCAAQFKSAEEVIDHVLSIDEDHFEARMRKAHWDKWEHLFQYPPWSLTATTLHPVMAAHLHLSHEVQIVRDGLQIGIAVVKLAQSSSFPSGLSNKMRSKWEPMWGDTPFGLIIPHYLLVEDNPSDPYKDEGILPTFVPEEIEPASGFWLLQRLSKSNSCFLVLCEGTKVIYNARYWFTPRLKATLSAMSQKVANLAAKKDLAGFPKACQWYRSNVDLQSVKIRF
jgi:hypothetical protein